MVAWMLLGGVNGAHPQISIDVSLYGVHIFVSLIFLYSQTNEPTTLISFYNKRPQNFYKII